jgi:galactofuranosylgalactofuranosylrhamnosyl-N-acetylglucosaminyl-diphospho-decaprenol beta-1,5/1,6-galactofuranosyltransferase
MNISAQDARWFLLSRLDSATVGTADGRGVTFRRREPDTFWRMLRRSVATHARLVREFPELEQRYRAQMSELTSPDNWARIFEQG